MKTFEKMQMNGVQVTRMMKDVTVHCFEEARQLPLAPLSAFESDRWRAVAVPLHSQFILHCLVEEDIYCQRQYHQFSPISPIYTNIPNIHQYPQYTPIFPIYTSIPNIHQYPQYTPISPIYTNIPNIYQYPQYTPVSTINQTQCLSFTFYCPPHLN